MCYRTLNRSFGTALSLLLAGCFQPVIADAPAHRADRSVSAATPDCSEDSGTPGIIRTTAAHPAINLYQTRVNLARTRLSLHPLTGAAAPVAGNSEPPVATPAVKSRAQSP
jgi:hypothetical protein